jgi:hypothetical protein
MKQVLGEVEEQIVTVLQAYHAKVEAAKKDDVPVQVVPATSLAPQAASPSKRKASVIVRNRRGSLSSKAMAEFISEGEAATSSSTGSTSTSKTAQQAAAVAEGCKSPSVKTAKAMLSKHQPYRYAGLRPPHMSMEELRKKDNMEEEYPLTYHELKVKVWHSDASQ